MLSKFFCFPPGQLLYQKQWNQQTMRQVQTSPHTQFNVVKRQEIQKLSKIHIYRFIRRRNSRAGTLLIIDSWYKVKIISKIQQLQLSKAEATCKRVGQSGLTGHPAVSRPQRHRLDGLSSQGLKGGSLCTPGVHFFKKPLDAVQKASESFSIRVLHL